MDHQIAFIQAFQAELPGLGGFFSAIAFLGMPEFYLIFIPLVLWCYDRALGLRLIAFLSISSATGDALKILFHAPRPYWISSGVTAHASMGSFGFPSSHAQNAVVFFGTIAATVRKWWVWITCILLMILIGLARVYQGVHFPTDILAGWGIGIVLLVCFLYLEKPARIWTNRQSTSLRILLAFCLSLALIGITGLFLFVTGSWQMPSSWATLALAQTGVPVDPFMPKDTVTTAGLLFGALAGAIVCPGRIASASGGSYGRIAARYLIGIVIVLLIWAALSGPAALPGIPGYLMIYCRSTLAGIWIVLGAPALFARAGLFGPAQDDMTEKAPF
ncbi:MAG: phosphatase PAP2 family protein [Methanoregula sp.]